MDLNKILKGCEISSVEFWGFYKLHFSTTNLDAMKAFGNGIEIEFISGTKLFEGKVVLEEHQLLELFGNEISNIEINRQHDLEIIFNDGKLIKSLPQDHPLLDRVWNINIIGDRENYIFFDGFDIYSSTILKELTT